MSEDKGISAAELKQILIEVAKQNAESTRQLVEELKKPTVLEQKELDKQASELAAKQQERVDGSAGIRAQIESKRNTQEYCLHKHSNGQSHCVHVKETNRFTGNIEGSGYIYCQLCEVRVRPLDSKPAGVKENHVGSDLYDSALFRRLLQEMPSGAIFQ